MANGIPAYSAAAAAAYAQGNLGKAMDYAASEDYTAMRAFAVEIIGKIHKLDINGALSQFQRFEKWKDSIQTLLDILYLCYRDVTAYKSTNRADAIRDPEGILIPAAKEIPIAALMANIDAVAHTKKVLRQNGNFQMAIEMLLLQLSQEL